MNNPVIHLSRLESFLGKESVVFFKNTTGNTELVSQNLKNIASTFFVNDPFGKYRKKQKTVLLDLEKKLTSQFSEPSSTKKELLQKVLDYTFSLQASNLPPTKYLKEERMRKILTDHPPKNLLEKYGAASINQLKSGHALPLLFSLTRITEEENWQTRFLELVGESTASDFEERSITFFTLGYDEFPDGLFIGKEKPWRTSHSKESGVIFLTVDENERIKTPIILYTLVFLHYVQETTAAGSLINSTKDGSLGEKLLQIITTTKKPLPGSNPNIFSETVFWEKALEFFFDNFVGAKEVGTFFNKFQGSLEGVLKKDVRSLNIIDQLWEINFYNNRLSEKYFGKKVSRFDYHLKESIFCELLKQAAGLSTKSFQEKVLQNLTVSDEQIIGLFLKN